MIFKWFLVKVTENCGKCLQYSKKLRRILLQDIYTNFFNSNKYQSIQLIG